MPETCDLAGVAVVDDEAGMIRAYQLLFRRRNIPVSFFSMTGEEALDQFRNASPRPKVVIIDYRLPAMDGIAVMNEILSLEPAARVIMISGDTTVGQECLDAGAKAFFRKPTSINEITLTVNNLLGG
jgi:two-component system, chemotaxis family, chemotaxis protein CheY